MGGGNGWVSKVSLGCCLVELLPVSETQNGTYRTASIFLHDTAQLPCAFSFVKLKCSMCCEADLPR